MYIYVKLSVLELLGVVTGLYFPVIYTAAVRVWQDGRAMCEKLLLWIIIHVLIDS